MIKIIKLTQPGRIIILSGLFCFLVCLNVLNAQESGRLTQNELNAELRTALEQNNEARIVELIKNHRLYIKPFVDALVKESIQLELKWKLKEAEKINIMASKTAVVFNEIFNEKSLLIGVNYLPIWSKDEKRMKLMADSLYAAGTNFRRSEPEKAIEIYQKAIEIYRTIEDERGESEILGGLGLIYVYIDYDTSLVYYKNALVMREKVDDKVLMGNTLNSLGSLYYGIFKDYTLALNYFNRAGKARQELGDSLNLGRTIHLKAYTLQNLGENEQSLVNYKRSLRLNQYSGDQIRVAEALLNIGTIFNGIGKYPEALENLGKAQNKYRILEDSTGISDSYNQIGFVYLNLGDLNTALEKFNEAISITKKLNDQWGLAGIYNNLGIMLQNAGRYEKALEYANNALNMYEELDDQSSVIVSLNNIGTIYYDMKDYHSAEEYYLRGLKMCRELKIKDQEANYLLNLANAQGLMGRMDEALLNYQEGFEIARTLNSPDLTWKFITGLAETYETSGEYDKVVELNDTALKILEGLRNTLPSQYFKATFMAKERYVYEDIIDLLGTLHEKDPAKGYDKLAFSYAEQSKSRVLLDQLGESFANSKNNSGGNPEKNHGSIFNPRPLTLTELQELAPDQNCVFLEYYVGDSSSSLWVVTRNDHRLFMLPGREILREQVETIRFALQDREQTSTGFFTQSGYTLFRELIQPAEKYFSNNSKLIIIPDGILNYLPFEVLLTETNEINSEVSFADLPFLVKNYPVSYAQSASVLKSLLAKQPGAEDSHKNIKTLIAFGDPVYEDANETPFTSSKKYHRLKYSGKEVENIASFFKKRSAEIYLRNAATEENVKRAGELKKFNYVHFATHGFIDENKPDLSSLILTQDNDSGEDGFLQATEIFNLDLNSDLVVLSACQTGLGKLVRGEGLVGLTRAFMYAGTPSVLVSLWSVSDISTATLMGEFYKNLIINKLGKTEALRKAQLTLMSDEKYAHPFYWAPFVLIGDWR